jgi:hypothetical protein
VLFSSLTAPIYFTGDPALFHSKPILAQRTAKFKYILSAYYYDLFFKANLQIQSTIMLDFIYRSLYNDYRMSKRRTSLFAADRTAGAKSSFLLFVSYIIATEIDKFPFEIC